MSWTGWSAAEDAMLVAHYQERGPSWRGWADLLPGRSKKAIKTRASRLGLTAPERRAASAVRHPSEHGQRVRDLMAKGKTPSQIDREMRWPEGKAKQVLMGTWETKGER